MALAVGLIADAYKAPAGGGFDPLSISWHTAFWAGDPAWTTHPADGVAVAQWDDATGNARHATQATAGNRPLWRASVAALNNKPAVDFVSNDWLGTATWTAIPQPWSLVVIAHLRVSGNNLQFTDGDDSTHRAYLGTWTAGQWVFYCGSNLTGGTGNTTAHLLVGYATANPNAQLEVDGVVLATGNTGAHTNTGLAFGGNFGASGGYSQSEIAFVGVYSGNVRTHANWAGFKTWVTSHYGIAVT